jgi:hypothetical protein
MVGERHFYRAGAALSLLARRPGCPSSFVIVRQSAAHQCGVQCQMNRMRRRSAAHVAHRVTAHMPHQPSARPVLERVRYRPRPVLVPPMRRRSPAGAVLSSDWLLPCVRGRIRSAALCPHSRRSNPQSGRAATSSCGGTPHRTHGVPSREPLLGMWGDGHLRAGTGSPQPG